MANSTIKKPLRWHIIVFLAPALLVYTPLMIVPLVGTLRLSLFRRSTSSWSSSASTISACCSAIRAGR